MKPSKKPESPRHATTNEIERYARAAASLSPLELDMARAQVAGKLGMRLHVFDEEVKRQKEFLRSLDTDRILLTDVGNAQRYVKRNAYNVRCCKQRSKLGWFVWNGAYWEADALGAAMELGRLTAIDIADEATKAHKADQIDGAVWQNELAWSISSQSHKSLSAMLAQASQGTELCIKGDKFDARPELFNLKNGTFNLETTEFCPHQRMNLITQTSNTDYEAKATCPLWEQFISTSLDGDQELIAYVRRVSGYLLTGSMKEQCFFLIQGKPGTGKSTYWRTLRFLFGDYFAMVPSGLFVKKSAWKAADGQGATPGLVALVGKRVACEVELSEGDKFDSGLIKRITGGESLTARPNYGGFFNFQPQCVPVFITNHTPGTNDFSGGLQARLRIVKFDHVIRGTDAEDKDLVYKLQAEASGILNWCLRGLAEYRKLEGLKEPEAIQTNVKKYFEDENIVARFLNEQATQKRIRGESVTDHDKLTLKLASFAQMFAAFKGWADTNEEEYGSARWFSDRMKQLGYETVCDRVNSKYYQFELLFPETEKLEGRK
jgi:putative DNA primase/helicase